LVLWGQSTAAAEAALIRKQTASRQSYTAAFITDTRWSEAVVGLCRTIPAVIGLCTVRKFATLKFNDSHSLDVL
jgi:hypothetical protein